ncbi:hypothetical protein K457DRAFT_507551 [Linnemannia elongata AG-77]|uniref:FHA domain-containing protein n=1 Tax=Linnemannia elongata AG-77 TaxID=1314771 RepID=A0A197JXE5_9FUNG|nr:hypothetical protein K457DRAFT_507551 [Linnemannia elongata AG-77]
MSGEETNMVGVERLEGKIVYAKRKPPSYLMDWKSIVDIQAIRSKEVKELLNRMLEIDPSQRIRIQHVLQTDWICMIDEELKKIELAAEQWARDFNNKPFIDGEDIEGLWGMLTIVPGSIPDAPRRIGLPDEKDEIWMGRRAEMVSVCLGSDVGLSAKHCVISRTPDGVMVGDASMNGTYINSQKIGLGRGMQLMDGDELGLVVPPDRTRFDEDILSTRLGSTKPRQSRRTKRSDGSMLLLESSEKLLRDPMSAKWRFWRFLKPVIGRLLITRGQRSRRSILTQESRDYPQQRLSLDDMMNAMLYLLATKSAVFTVSSNGMRNTA